MYKTCMQVFVKNEVSDIMCSCGFSEGGMKVFGSFEKYEITSKEPMSEAVQKNFIQHIMSKSEVLFVQAGKYYSFKDDNIKMYSNGKKFVWKTDMLEALKDFTEVKIEGIPKLMNYSGIPISSKGLKVTPEEAQEILKQSYSKYE